MKIDSSFNTLIETELIMTSLVTIMTSEAIQIFFFDQNVLSYLTGGPKHMMSVSIKMHDAKNRCSPKKIQHSKNTVHLFTTVLSV